MQFSRIFRLTFFTLCFAAAVFAQKDQEKTKSKEQIELESKAYTLVSEIIDESALLKLPENRAFVFSIAGKLIWEKDEEAARRLIQNAADELLRLQSLPKYRPESDKGNFSFYMVNNLRGQLIYSLRQKDAEFALEILYSTRSPEIAAAVQMYQQIITETGKNPNFSDYKQDVISKLQIARSEIETEQTIKREITKKDPQKLAESIREAFAKDIGAYQILFDLETLNKKDSDLAQKLLAEIMSKLAEDDFSNSPGKSTLTFFIYARYLEARKNNEPSNAKSDKQNKSLVFEEKSVKAIAGNEIDYFSGETQPRDDGNFIQKAFYLKQILPERFREIEKKYETVKKNNADWVESWEVSQKLGENPTLDQIIENSSKLQPYRKADFYRKAIGNLLETESEEKIAQKLERLSNTEDKEKALDILKSLTTKKIAEKQNFPEALKSINQIKSENERTARLIDLAIYYNQKKTDESRKIAEDLMGEAEKSVKKVPETATEHEAVLPIIAGYAKINSSKAFDLIVPIIQQSNEVINAYILYASYDDRNYPYVSEKEIIFAAQEGYNSYKSKYSEISRILAQNDYERTKKNIGSFQREDIRIMAKLILAESILAQ